MSGFQELGKCDICGHTGIVVRTYYYYDIKCKCCSPVHFELVKHCRDCTPSPPQKITVQLSPTGTAKGVKL